MLNEGVDEDNEFGSYATVDEDDAAFGSCSVVDNDEDNSLGS